MTQIHPEHSPINEAREHSQIHNTTTHLGGLDSTNIALISALGVTLLIAAAAIMVSIWTVVEVKEARASIQYYERAFKACMR